MGTARRLGERCKADNILCSPCYNRLGPRRVPLGTSLPGFPFRPRSFCWCCTSSLLRTMASASLAGCLRFTLYSTCLTRSRSLCPLPGSLGFRPPSTPPRPPPSPTPRPSPEPPNPPPVANGSLSFSYAFLSIHDNSHSLVPPQSRASLFTTGIFTNNPRWRHNLRGALSIIGRRLSLVEYTAEGMRVRERAGDRA